MMLEALFARQGQAQVFLALVLCGWALGLLLHAGRWLRRRHRVLSMLWDEPLPVAMPCFPCCGRGE